MRIARHVEDWSSSVAGPKSTSPYAFHGHGLDALGCCSGRAGLPIVTEAMDEGQVELVEEWADVIQIGARNMQNYSLLRRVGRAKKPVILKRGLAASVDEFLNAAEYILSEGNEEVVLCERGKASATCAVPAGPGGGRSPMSRPTPVIVDPSHPAGLRRLVAPLARAGLAAGADGLIIEVPEPDEALSDGQQALRFGDITALAAQCRKVSVCFRSFGATIWTLPATELGGPGSRAGVVVYSRRFSSGTTMIEVRTHQVLWRSSRGSRPSIASVKVRLSGFLASTGADRRPGLPPPNLGVRPH